LRYRVPLMKLSTPCEFIASQLVREYPSLRI